MKKLICGALAAMLLFMGCAFGEGGVAALSGSLAEIWLLAGGELAGVTDDAIDERGLEIGEDVQILGSLKDPGAEMVLAMQPDLVIYSPDIENQVSLAALLDERGIKT